MENRVIVQGDYAILPGAKAIAQMKGSSADYAGPIITPPYDVSPNLWSNWGSNNLFPQDLLTDLESNSVAMRALDKRKRVHFGRGIVAYREKKDAAGEVTREIVTDPVVTEFFRVNKINLQWPDLILGLEIFANGWVEFILNKGKTQVNRIYVKDPAYCRVAKMDENDKIDFMYYSARWEMMPQDDGTYMKDLPMFDSSRYDGTKYPDGQFAMQLSYRSFNKSYYALPVWHSVRANKWLSIANKVPMLKEAIMKNQMTIKYHIEIPDDYFTTRFPPADYTKEQREAKRAEVLQDMNDFLANVENSGKALVTYAFYSKAKQDYLTGWKINVIENKLENSAYLPDSQAANSEILFAIGVDPCLIGAGLPGGKMGAGSGSDKREAYWMLNADMGTDRAVSLSPLYFIRDFNHWDPTIQFDYICVDTSQTQDQHPSKINQKVDKTQP